MPLFEPETSPPRADARPAPNAVRAAGKGAGAGGRGGAAVHGPATALSPESATGNRVWIAVGLLGSLFASLCCIGVAPLVALVTAVGMGFMLSLTVLPPLFVFFLAVGAVGQWRSSRRHGNLLPLILHLAGGAGVTVLLFTAWHGPWAWVGLAAIIAAAGWNLRLEYLYWHREPVVEFPGPTT